MFFNALIPQDKNFVLKSEKVIENKNHRTYQRESIKHFNKVHKYLQDYLPWQITLIEENSDKIYVIQEKVNIWEMKLLKSARLQDSISELKEMLSNQKNIDILTKFVSWVEALFNNWKLVLDWLWDNIFYWSKNWLLEIKIIDTWCFEIWDNNNEVVKKDIEIMRHMINELRVLLEQSKSKELLYEEDLQKAKEYWSNKLDWEVLISTPQTSSCEISFIIPVFNERADRTLKQLNMFKSQQVKKEVFEIIYIINNDLPWTKNWSIDKIAANAATIEVINKFKSENPEMHIHIIDKSTAWNEIKDCSVWKARNRWIAEASMRFFNNSKNWLIINTDWDSYFEDESYIDKILSEAKKDPDMIWAAWWIKYEFDPDNTDEKEIAILRKKFNLFMMQREYDMLWKFIKNPNKSTLFQNTDFSWAHMISKSFETACLGWLSDANIAEDVDFWTSLKLFAQRRWKNVLWRRNDYFVITAWRESDRTWAWFKWKLDKIDPDKPVMTTDSTKKTVKEVKEDIFVLLKQNIHDKIWLRKVFDDYFWKDIPSEIWLEAFYLFHQDKNDIDLSDPFYKIWKEKYIDSEEGFKPKALEWIDEEFELTSKEIVSLEEIVRKMPWWNEYIANMRNNLTSARNKDTHAII